jgi:hypothetical protein
MRQNPLLCPGTRQGNVTAGQRGPRPDRELGLAHPRSRSILSHLSLRLVDIWTRPSTITKPPLAGSSDTLISLPLTDQSHPISRVTLTLGRLTGFKARAPLAPDGRRIDRHRHAPPDSLRRPRSTPVFVLSSSSHCTHTRSLSTSSTFHPPRTETTSAQSRPTLVSIDSLIHTPTTRHLVSHISTRLDARPNNTYLIRPDIPAHPPAHIETNSRRTPQWTLYRIFFAGEQSAVSSLLHLTLLSSTPSLIRTRPGLSKLRPCASGSLRPRSRRCRPRRGPVPFGRLARPRCVLYHCPRAALTSRQKRPLPRRQRRLSALPLLSLSLLLPLIPLGSSPTSSVTPLPARRRGLWPRRPVRSERFPRQVRCVGAMCGLHSELII